jgi:hypothetical protein
MQGKRRRLTAYVVSVEPVQAGNSRGMTIIIALLILLAAVALARPHRTSRRGL